VGDAECGASKHWDAGKCVVKSCLEDHTSICSKPPGHSGKHEEKYPGAVHRW
jgi:hypothetical protein